MVAKKECACLERGGRPQENVAASTRDWSALRIRIIISQRFPVTVGLVLAALALLLTLVSVLGHVSHYLVFEHLPGSPLESVVTKLDAFYLDEESSFPTLYAAAMLLLCSALLAGIALSRSAVGARYVWRWRFLAAIFLYLFADEMLQIHEKANGPLRSALGTDGLLYYAWIIPAVILLLVFGVLYARFVIALPAEIRLLFLAAGLLYVAGAAGLEMVGGYYASSSGVESAGYVAESNVEELLEMLGTAMFVYALLQYMRSHVEEITVPPASEKL